ncbi:putative RNA-directed DNA polymerase [Tanacetum coccineum]
MYSDRSDNGGVYIGLDAYCKEHGIQHQKTPPKTPQLNGLVERMNRTLVERVRCLLSHAGLPASFWGEALNTGRLFDSSTKETCSLAEDVEFVEDQNLNDFGDDIQNDKEQNDEETWVSYAQRLVVTWMLLVVYKGGFAHAVCVVSRFPVKFLDSDLAGNKGTKMKSYLGYLMTFARGAVSWKSRCKVCGLVYNRVSIVAASASVQRILWLKRFCKKLGFKQQRYAVSSLPLDGMFVLIKVLTACNASDMLSKAYVAMRKVERLIVVRRVAKLILIEENGGDLLGIS